MRTFLVVLIAVVATSTAIALDTRDLEDFREELYVRRATDGASKANEAFVFHFQFTTRWLQNRSVDDAFHWQHFNLFPKSLGQAIHKFGVEEFNLAFSKGAWNQDHWGYPFESAPSGLELWSVFEDKSVRSEYGSDSAWTRIVRHFSGSFCASLEQLGGSHAAAPSLAFGLSPNVTEGEGKGLALRYGQLPMEVSCTENLTPWFKLLPTRSRAGLAKFIVPSRVYSAMHHTMRTHFRRVCYDADRDKAEKGNESDMDKLRALKKNWQGCAVKVAELVQSFTVVFRREGEGLKDPLQLLEGKKGTMALGPSTVASRSELFVETSAGVADGGAYDLVALPLEADRERKVARFDLKRRKVSGEELAKVARRVVEGSIVKRVVTVDIKRATFGTGQVNGGISCVVAADLSGILQAKLRILELVPSYIRIRPSSINITVQADDARIPHVSLLRFSRFQGPPGTLEYEVDVSGKKSVSIYLHYEFDKAFQKLDAFPPDANRGFDVPATLVVLEKASTRPFYSDSPLLSRLSFLPNVNMRVYSNLLLISMPLPDFSMPFNVITLSSTIIALMFGNVLNAVARRVDKDQSKKKGFLERLKLKLKTLKLRFIRSDPADQ